MKIYTKFNAQLMLDGVVYQISGSNRDWNPLPNMKPPSGTIWEVRADGTDFCAIGGSQTEAVQNLRRMIRANLIYGIIKHKFTPQAIQAAHDDVDYRISQWHDLDNNLELPIYLGWTDQEYAIFVEDNLIPTKEIEKYL